MATTLYASSHISGSVSTPANALGAPNGTFTTDAGNVSWTSRFAMSDPPAGPVSGTHTITVRVRKEPGQSGTPSVTSITLYENGVSKQTLSSGSTSVTSTTGQDIVLSLPLSTLQTMNLNNVEIEVVTLAAGGSPGARAAVQLDSIAWTGDFVPPPTAPTSAPTISFVGEERINVTTPATLQGGATSYNIYGNGALVSSQRPVNYTYLNTGVNPTAATSYTVRGVNAAGMSSDGPSVSATANPAPPAVSLRRADSKVTVKITGRFYSATYKIYRGLAGGSRTLVHTSPTQTANASYDWEDTSVTNGVEYDYTVVTNISTPTSRDSSHSEVQSITPNIVYGARMVWVSNTPSNFDAGEQKVVDELLGRGHEVTHWAYSNPIVPSVDDFDVMVVGADIAVLELGKYVGWGGGQVIAGHFWSDFGLASTNLTNIGQSLTTIEIISTHEANKGRALGSMSFYTSGMQNHTATVANLGMDAINLAQHDAVAAEVMVVAYEVGGTDASFYPVPDRRIGLPYLNWQRFGYLTPEGIDYVSDLIEWAAGDYGGTPPTPTTLKAKVHNGADWIECPVKIHNGTDWVEVPIH